MARLLLQVVERVASAQAVGVRSQLASQNLRLLEKVGPKEVLVSSSKYPSTGV